MTKLQTWTMTGLGLVTLVVGVILAGLAVTNAQSPTPSATPSASPGTGTFESNEDPAHEANESPEWEAAEDAGTAFRGGPGCGGGLLDIKAAAAEVLGVSESDLHTALDSGQTLADVAQSKGMSTDDFKSALTTKVTSDLQSKLDAGTITQSQFDQAKSGLSDHIDDIVNGQFHGGMGYHGGRGFGPGRFYQGGPGSGDSTQGTSGA